MKIGDVVQLKSGGPLMTVVKADPQINDTAIVAVFFNGTTLERVSLKESWINKVEKTETPQPE
jgi:uncharacterized protein YodC (DUF2158 family)